MERQKISPRPILLVAAVAGIGCGSKESGPPDQASNRPTTNGELRTTLGEVANVSRNEFFGRGAPTFVRGTAGDDLADRRIAAQVGLIRGLGLPDSKTATDRSIDVSKGPAAWPTRPVLYGRPDENSVVAALAPSLPFTISEDKIEIGGKTYQGDGYRLVAVVPARAADATGPGYPEFLLFAGTGPGGIAEINASLPGGAPILIADGFGGLVAGRWERGKGGAVVADMTLAPGRRIRYRSVERILDSADGRKRVPVTFRFPEMVDRRTDEVAFMDACMRGLATVVRKLEVIDPVPLSVHVYPDKRSKQQLSGNGGHGHAVPSARALHVLQMSEGVEGLVAHEGTHVLGYYAWGPAGTALMGEGLAVWVSGSYQGQTLDSWKSRLDGAPTVDQMISSHWLRLPEDAKYPAAAIVVDEAMKAVGSANVRDHLLSATFDTWAEACDDAGTRAGALQEMLERALGRSDR